MYYITPRHSDTTRALGHAMAHGIPISHGRWRVRAWENPRTTVLMLSLGGPYRWRKPMLIIGRNFLQVAEPLAIRTFRTVLAVAIDAGLPMPPPLVVGSPTSGEPLNGADIHSIRDVPPWRRTTNVMRWQIIGAPWQQWPMITAPLLLRARETQTANASAIDVSRLPGSHPILRDCSAPGNGFRLVFARLRDDLWRQELTAGPVPAESGPEPAAANVLADLSPEYLNDGDGDDDDGETAGDGGGESPPEDWCTCQECDHTWDRESDGSSCPECGWDSWA